MILGHLEEEIVVFHYFLLSLHIELMSLILIYVLDISTATPENNITNVLLQTILSKLDSIETRLDNHTQAIHGLTSKILALKEIMSNKKPSSDSIASVSQSSTTSDSSLSFQKFESLLLLDEVRSKSLLMEGGII